MVIHEELYNTTVNKLPHVSVSPQEDKDYIYLYKSLIGEMTKLKVLLLYLHSLQEKLLSGSRQIPVMPELKGIIPEQENNISFVEADMVRGRFPGTRVFQKFDSNRLETGR